MTLIFTVKIAILSYHVFYFMSQSFAPILLQITCHVVDFCLCVLDIETTPENMESENTNLEQDHLGTT